jgi:hypothetical protein
MRRMPPRLTYSNVTASLALFVALGGTSYAVTRLPRNSVGSNQVRDGSLQPKDLSSAARAVPVRGPRGPAGPAGDRGPSSVRIAPEGATVNLSGAGGVQTQVRRLDNLPAGSWLLRFSANQRLIGPIGLHAFCMLKVNGDVKATAAATVGESANVTQELGVSAETALAMPSAFTVTVDCFQSVDSSPPVQIIRPQIVATQVSEVLPSP